VLKKSGVVKKVVKSITYSTTNNIHNYFPAQLVPAQTQDTPLPNLFPQGEREIRKSHHNGGTYRRIRSNKNGELIGDCGACSKKYKPMTAFAPDECNQNTRKRLEFFETLETYKTEYAAGNLDGARNARTKMNALRCTYCPSCRITTRKLNNNERACKDCWVSLRQEACVKYGGCINQGCDEKGANAWHVLEADHIDPSDKIMALSDYKYWAYNGGPEAMHIEASKVQWLCRYCHRLEKTSSAANRCDDPDLMSNGSAKYKAKVRHPKHIYVDAEKIRRGFCFHCHRAVTPSNVIGFEFDHIDPATKLSGKRTLAGKNGGVSGLVANCAKCATLDEIRHVIDDEMAKCSLLCCNCHKRKTLDYDTDQD
jgi:hypothetical protein